jgi:hypothetical protein
MDSIVIAAITFACAAGGVALGVLLRPILPESHLRDDSKEVIKLGTGLIGTMAALVLGLLVASATSAFNAEDSSFQQLAADLVLLDRALEHYGPEASDARSRLRHAVATLLDRLRPEAGVQSSRFNDRELTVAGNALYDSIRGLKPASEDQKAIRTQALQIALELAKTRLVLGQGEDSSVPVAFLVVLMFWLAVLYTGFGLLAPRNATAILVLVLCAISLAAAMFLILDLGRPFEGLIRISSDPLREAQSQMSQ